MEPIKLTGIMKDIPIENPTTQKDIKVRVPMIMNREGFKWTSATTGSFEGGLYHVTSGGVGILYKKINHSLKT